MRKTRLRTYVTSTPTSALQTSKRETCKPSPDHSPSSCRMPELTQITDCTSNSFVDKDRLHHCGFHERTLCRNGQEAAHTMKDATINDCGDVLGKAARAASGVCKPHSSHDFAANPTDDHSARCSRSRAQSSIPRGGKNDATKSTAKLQRLRHRRCSIIQREVNLAAARFAEALVQKVSHPPPDHNFSNHWRWAATSHVTAPRIDTRALQTRKSQGHSRCNRALWSLACPRRVLPKPGGARIGRRRRKRGARLVATYSPKILTSRGNLFTSVKYLVCFS